MQRNRCLFFFFKLRFFFVYNKFVQYDVNKTTLQSSSEFAYPTFQISTGEQSRAKKKKRGKKYPVRNEEFIELRLGREFEGEEKLFPGHETTTSQRVYSHEGKRGRIIAVRFIAKVGAETSRGETPFIGDPSRDRKREERKKA